MTTRLLQNPEPDWRDTIDQVKRAVPMREALRIVSWKTRSRNRCDCGLCNGSSRETVAFNDRLWKCHRCGEGGDVFSLIEKAHNCDFKTALKFLAGEARVELPGNRKLSPEERRRCAAEQAKRKRVGNAAEKLEAAERGLRLQYRELIHRCERKQREVSTRLAELMNGAPERWCGEREGCWNWLVALASLLRHYIATYWIAAFASARDRATFALRPAMRQAMVDRVLFERRCGLRREAGGGVVVSGDMSYEKILEEDSDLLHAAEQLKEKPADPKEVGAVLLQDIIDFLLRFVFMTVAQAIVLALWTIHAHCFAAGDATPYMNVNSPEKESGKTRTLEVEDLLVPNSWFTGRVTAACLTRKIDAQHPTLLLDESDAAFASGEEYAEALRGVLNTGHRRGGKTSCCVGKGANIGFADFETFCPKMIAGLTKLPDTVNSRAVPITLQRKPKNVTVERFRRRKVKPEADTLRARIEAWSKSQIKRLRKIEPELPDQLSDRQADGAEPLLAIAELVGHGWPEKARKALVELCTSADAEDLSPGVRLLTDIAAIFIAIADADPKNPNWKDADRISSATLVDRLAGIETSPWAEWGKSRRPITPSALAKLLKKYNSYDDKKIEPRTIRIGESTLRGYYRRDFLDAWKRYTPNVSASLTEAAEKDKPDDEEQRQEAEPPQSALFDATAADCCSSQSATATEVKQVSPNKDAPCCTVAVETGDTREEESVEGEL